MEELRDNFVKYPMIFQQVPTNCMLKNFHQDMVNIKHILFNYQNGQCSSTVYMLMLQYIQNLRRHSTQFLYIHSRSIIKSTQSVPFYVTQVDWKQRLRNHFKLHMTAVVTEEKVKGIS